MTYYSVWTFQEIRILKFYYEILFHSIFSKLFPTQPTIFLNGHPDWGKPGTSLANCHVIAPLTKNLGLFRN